MGSGSWSVSDYHLRATTKASVGESTFHYHDTMASTEPRSAWKPHDSLNPMGLKMRESRDSSEHPESLAVVVLFDVTGSMGTIPVTLQKKLPDLMGLLLRRGYVEHPQILFGAIGDATCDSVSLQIGQFESDNRIDQCLENLVLEHGGGAYITESYELGMYTIARHTSIDCLEKRGKKGYLFMIGDEIFYPSVKRDEVSKLIGDTLQSDIPTAEIIDELKRKYEVFFILPRQASHGGDLKVLQPWREHLGQNVLELDDPHAVCETIALAIGLCEGVIDLVDGVEHLRETGISEKLITSTTSALRNISTDVAVVRTETSTLPDLVSQPTDSNIRRL